MRDIPVADKNQNQSDERPTIDGPQGIGMAVAFDWGLAVQILATPFVGRFSSANPFKSLPVVVAFLLVLPFAALIAIFGEGVRRGWRWTRPIQIGFNALGFLGGLASLYVTWQSIQRGNYWPIVTEVILLVFSPLIAWRLSRPVSARWFASVTSAEARKRHGGLWPYLIAIWAIVGGILQAIAALSH